MLVQDCRLEGPWDFLTKRPNQEATRRAWARYTIRSPSRLPPVETAWSVPVTSSSLVSRSSNNDPPGPSSPPPTPPPSPINRHPQDRCRDPRTLHLPRPSNISPSSSREAYQSPQTTGYPQRAPNGGFVESRATNFYIAEKFTEQVHPVDISMREYPHDTSWSPSVLDLQGFDVVLGKAWLDGLAPIVDWRQNTMSTTGRVSSSAMSPPGSFRASNYSCFPWLSSLALFP